MNKDQIIKNITSLISKSVRSGAYMPDYLGEKPTLERIKASIPQLILGVNGHDYDEITECVYKKLRKNGILAILRKNH